jgi:large subunit ribosomal protein L2
MGKRPLVRRRGRGGMQFRAVTTGKLNRAKYPSFLLSEQHEGKIIDLIHERGRDAPLAKIRFEDNSTSIVPESWFNNSIWAKIRN